VSPKGRPEGEFAPKRVSAKGSQCLPVRWLALALLALVASVPARAGVTTADRSPFAQGHWWEPARSGSGFDIFSAAGNVGVVWFTYDAAGKPVWYTAVGALAGMGAQSWPLMKHRWTGGSKQAPVEVGALTLKLRNPELLEVAWTLDGKSGTSVVEPLTFAGVVNEIDHSGHWFDPANSGWGFSLQEQGDVLGGALFTYDAAGEPTWVSGYVRGATTVEYASFSGACPSCSYRAPQSASAGRLTFEFAGEATATVRNGLTLAMAQGTNIDGARVSQLGRPASTRPADRQLASFATEAALEAYLDSGMMNVPPQSGTSFSAAPPPTPYSPTNLQEAGVDEADVVKSDGQFVYTFLHDANGTRKPAVRVARVDSGGATIGVVGSVPLASGPNTPVGNAGLYRYADKVVTITGTQAAGYSLSSWTSPYDWTRGGTFVEVMDATASGLPVTRWRAQIDGTLVSSRRIGGRLYVVSRFVPWIAGFSYGVGFEPYASVNRQLLAATPLSQMLPTVRVGDSPAVPLLQTASIYLPPQGARPAMADMILVTAIDLDQPGIVQSLAIVGTVDAVYASSANLFVATSRSNSMFPNTSGLPAVEPAFYLTDIHQIGLGASTMTVVGSASLEGYLDTNPDKASFRLSEYQGRLRAVTSSASIWGGVNRNRLTILERSTTVPGLLKTLAYLPNKQRPEPLGKPYELVYGTRFVADRLYAVTFRVVDPLYVIDLADSTDPRIAAALELPGFSEYLHPLPSGLLLGFGKDAKPAGTAGDGQGAWYQGLQLSLYDVRDLGKPRELQRVLIGKRGSDSALLRDHHAFAALLQADGTGSVAFPVRVADGQVPQSGSGDSAWYAWQWSGLARYALQGTSAADARLVALPPLVTHTAVPVTNSPFADPAITTGRAVLFGSGSVYVGNGQFWSQDATGKTFGPY